MDDVFNQISSGLAQLNDSLRAAFLPPGARLFLLRRAELSGELKPVTELIGGWFIEFSEYRGQFKLLIAELSGGGFNDEIARTSFIAYGVVAQDGTLDVFAIDSERRDVIPPNGTSPFWKIYVTRDAETRFAPPADEG